MLKRIRIIRPRSSLPPQDTKLLATVITGYLCTVGTQESYAVWEPQSLQMFLQKENYYYFRFLLTGHFAVIFAEFPEISFFRADE